MHIDLLIPTKNRPESLARTLRLTEHTAARTLVCDQSASPSGSTSPRGYAQTYHRPDLSGLPAARNVLLAESTAEVVVFLDDDTDLAADFVVRLRECIVRWPNAAGWGPVLEVRSRAVRRIHRLVHLGCLHDPRRLTGARRDQGTAALFGACFAVRRSEALAVGFDARRPGYALGEDLDFCKRLAKGREFRFCRDLKAIHRCDGANRAEPHKRGKAKGEFLVWLARRHGGQNPCTIFHLLLALVVAGLGGGRERANASGVFSGIRSWLW